VLAGWRPRRRPVRRDWFRLADRLAAGMAPQAAVPPEGTDAAVVKELLAREDFRTRVEASREAWCHEGSSELVEAEPRPAREHPRRTRGP
jgi:hypothetical protein